MNQAHQWWYGDIPSGNQTWPRNIPIAKGGANGKIKWIKGHLHFWSFIYSINGKYMKKSIWKSPSILHWLGIFMDFPTSPRVKPPKARPNACRVTCAWLIVAWPLSHTQMANEQPNYIDVNILSKQIKIDNLWMIVNLLWVIWLSLSLSKLVLRWISQRNNILQIPTASTLLLSLCAAKSTIHIPDLPSWDGALWTFVNQEKT